MSDLPASAGHGAAVEPAISDQSAQDLHFFEGPDGGTYPGQKMAWDQLCVSGGLGRATRSCQPTVGRLGETATGCSGYAPGRTKAAHR